MLALNLRRGEWLAIGEARVKFDELGVVVDAPKEVPVCRGRLLRKVHRHFVARKSDYTSQELQALARLCELNGDQDLARQLIGNRPTSKDVDSALVEAWRTRIFDEARKGIGDA